MNIHEEHDSETSSHLKKNFDNGNTRRKETVYVSDGVSSPSFSAPNVPHIHTGFKSNGIENTLDTCPCDPFKAFETFHGKKFTPLSVSPLVDMETPFQKMARLRNEVKQLEHDIESNKRGCTGRDILKKNDEEMEKSIADLSYRLSGCQKNLNIDGEKYLKQLDLTNCVRSEETKLSTIYNAVKNDPLKNSSCSPKRSEYNPNKIATENSSSDLELRLERIEMFIKETYDEGTQPLIKRLNMMEEKIEKLNEKTLNEISMKAKIIRVDLEAASKAKNHLRTVAKGEDYQIIGQLHEQLLDLDGFVSSSLSSNSLSNTILMIVQRLSDCAKLHESASLFGSELKELERSANDIERLVKSLEKALMVMKSGMNTNMEIIKQNMSLLDERMKNIDVYRKSK